MTPPAIGILGGTFDPVHFGHLRLAEEVADALRLAVVRFIPGGTPPHRSAPRTAAAHRVAMVALAIAGNPRFILDARETRRAGPSYTFDTLAALRAELGATQPLALIMGADAFVRFDTWHRWRDIFDLAHIAVAHRPGARLADMPTALAAEYARRRHHGEGSSGAAQAPAGKVFEIAITALDISATAIRTLAAHGASTHYLLPREVEAYIADNQLFTEPSPA